MVSNFSLLHLITSKAPLEEIAAALNSLTDHGGLFSAHTEKDDGGRTALHHAARDASHDVVKTLLDSIPNEMMQTVLQMKTNRGSTPVFIAAKNPSGEVMRLLLSKVSDRKLLLEMICEGRESDQATSFQWAATNPSAGVIELLLTAVGDNKGRAEIIKQKNNDGRTIVHYAAEYGTVEVFTYTP